MHLVHPGSIHPDYLELETLIVVRPYNRLQDRAGLEREKRWSKTSARDHRGQGGSKGPSFFQNEGPSLFQRFVKRSQQQATMTIHQGTYNSISTRRLSCRPSAVSLLAVGWVSPALPA